MSVCENYQAIEEKVREACKKAGRDRKEVTLIAVSKTKPLSMIEELLPLGVRDFGENKVQELVDKYEQLPKDIRWHMIGHLQRNKVKHLIGRTALIHGVDSLRLAEEIEKEAAKQDIIVDILLEVNIAGEESKFGIAPGETLELVKTVSALQHVRLRGLMTIAPFTDTPEENREHFHALKQLSVDIAQKNIDNVSMEILSMGMSNDYEIAVEEGATYVRVGTGIFGMRSLA